MKPEAAFQKMVVDLAQMSGWKVAHFRPAKTEDGWRTAVSADGKGFPDLCMARGERIVFAEIKAKSGKLSAEQRDWRHVLNLTTAEYYLWYPADWDSVVEVLRG